MVRWVTAALKQGSIQMRFSLAFLLSAFYSLAIASPTSNEYLPCHKMAASMLLNCLDERPGYVNDQCWESSRHQTNVCYAEVKKSHRPDPDMIEAKKKAMEIRRKDGF
jgi:hypothetical protein